jgi:hypothetical protein
VIVAFGSGGVEPQLKTSTCPGKGGTTTPDGQVIVRISVSLAVQGEQTAVVVLVALMVMRNVPMAVGVPEISPGVQPSELSWQTVNPWGKSGASKVVGLLLAVIW